MGEVVWVLVEKRVTIDNYTRQSNVSSDLTISIVSSE